MGATIKSLAERAKELGGNSADAYSEEFGVGPDEDGTEKVGDWDSSAWSLHWHELRDAGATDADYDACLVAWREGFWGTTAADPTGGYVPDGIYSRDELVRLKSVRPAWSGVVPDDEQESCTVAIHALAREALEAVDEAYTHSESDTAEFAARIEGGCLVEVVDAD